MRKVLGCVVAGAAGVLWLGRWLKERRDMTERRAWRRVRNVWSPVHAGCRCVAQSVGECCDPLPASPSSSSKDTLDTGGGVELIEVYGDDPDEWAVWHAETLRWEPVVKRVIDVLQGGHPSERLLRYAVDDIQNELSMLEVGDVGKQG